MAQNDSGTKQTALEGLGLWLATWSERWFPDSWVFALLGVAVVFVLGILTGESPTKLAIKGEEEDARLTNRTLWIDLFRLRT